MGGFAVVEVPPHISQTIDEDLVGMYDEAIERLGTTDIVLYQDKHDHKVVCYASREGFIEALRADIGKDDADYARYVEGVVKQIDRPATDVAFTRFAFWYLFPEDVGLHVFAIGLRKKEERG